MQAVLEQKLITETRIEGTSYAFGKKIGIFGKLFGCWHKNLTRPFSDKHGSYMACLDCGARKAFDLQSFKTSGAFYYPPSVAFDRN